MKKTKLTPAIFNTSGLSDLCIYMYKSGLHWYDSLHYDGIIK